MSRNISNSSNRQSYLVRQNSLPTYEEATGKVQATKPALVLVHSSAVVNNVNEHVSAQYRPQTHLSTPRLPLRPRTDLNVEIGLQRDLQRITTHTDPIVRQTTQTVITEYERARRNKEASQKAALVVVIILFYSMIFILIALKISKPK